MSCAIGNDQCVRPNAQSTLSLSCTHGVPEAMNANHTQITRLERTYVWEMRHVKLRAARPSCAIGPAVELKETDTTHTKNQERETKNNSQSRPPREVPHKSSRHKCCRRARAGHGGPIGHGLENKLHRCSSHTPCNGAAG